MKRTMGLDVLACPACGKRMKIIAAITKEDVVRRILAAMGLRTEAPEPLPARAPPQLRFEFDQT